MVSMPMTYRLYTSGCYRNVGLNAHNVGLYCWIGSRYSSCEGLNS